MPMRILPSTALSPAQEDSMKAILWGVRGSISVSSPHTQRYGGNTACVEVPLPDGNRCILDAGTGIRALGADMLRRSPTGGACCICISHAHWDHVMGLTFFAPLFDPRWEVTICGPESLQGQSLEALLRRLFDPASFPVGWEQLARPPRVIPLRPGGTLEMGPLRILPTASNHPGGCLAYRLEADGHAIFYSGDHELGEAPPDLDAPFYAAMRNVDVAIVDGQYTAGDYAARRGWGHSAMEQWGPLQEPLGVERMVIVHFDPDYTDSQLDSAAQNLEERFPHLTGRLMLGHEGMEIDAAALRRHTTFHQLPQETCRNCTFSRELFEFTDVSMVFERLLTEARRQTHADAGTIYLVEDEHLIFAYSQNETLFTASQWAQQQYLSASLPINAQSIAGFVALCGTTLNIADVRTLAKGLPYAFNESFDKATGYRTVSMCTTPLRAVDGSLVGVLQLINSAPGGHVRPFSDRMLHQVENISGLGAQAIERGRMVRGMILRMLKTAALRDPTETAGHVLRVGAMVAEIYHRWAETRNLELAEILRSKDQLRLAAMLHDVGKVGIADSVLRKPGALTPHERREMERHSALGAQLFQEARWDLDTLAHDIALHHHQRWDGTGYTGSSTIPPLAGEDIPLGARLTAVADVFDALVSPRCYKPAWEPQRAFDVIKSNAGAHFDPQVVTAFLEIQDTVLTIAKRYTG